MCESMNLGCPERKEAANSYASFERKSRSSYNRRCIDGSITGCGSCVGYCTYSAHSGFLTRDLRKQHDCIKKGCYYYLPKPKDKTVKQPNHTQNELLMMAQRLTAELEGLRVLHVIEQLDGSWNVEYVTISNCYQMDALEQKLTERSGQAIRFQKLDYDFDRVVQLLCREPCSQ